jgi:prephenate dehydratase
VKQVIAAYQGEPGAFSEMAIVEMWGRVATPLPCATFADVITAVESGRADIGMLPTENSIAGPVNDSIAAIERSALFRGKAPALGIHLMLLALPGATLASLRSVESHPVALRQCGEFLGRHPHLVPRPSHDTAGAAREVAASGDVTRAAIASARAGELNGLITLAEGLEDRTDNVTQFAVVARDESLIRTNALDAPTRPANLER